MDNAKRQPPSFLDFVLRLYTSWTQCHEMCKTDSYVNQMIFKMVAFPAILIFIGGSLSEKILLVEFF